MVLLSFCSLLSEDDPSSSSYCPLCTVVNQISRFGSVGFTMPVLREMSELETKTPSLRYGCTLLTLLTGYEEYTFVMLIMHLRSCTQNNQFRVLNESMICCRLIYAMPTSENTILQSTLLSRNTLSPMYVTI